MSSNRDAHLLIPPRWLKCPRKSSLIADKFIVLKTPLDDRYDDQIADEFKFDVHMFFGSLKNNRTKIGLMIDLTNTDRFYNKEDLESYGCKYIKLNCKGHGEAPSQQQADEFSLICDNFIRKNPLEKLGIHCTHGFNRSGFLIISYLVKMRDWSFEAALESFKIARPPGIYKQHYLDELHTRFADDSDEPPLAPPLPDWSIESDDGDEVDDDGNSIRNNFRSNIRPEIIKSNAVFMDGLVNDVTTLYESRELAYVQTTIKHMCSWKKSGFPGAQPISMDRHNIRCLTMQPYKVSWKADGTRYMMLIDGPNKVYMIDRDNCVYHVSNIIFPCRKDPSKHLSQTLLDGEMIIDSFEGESIPRYLIYDIVKFEGQDVGKTDFDRRLLCISKEIVKTRNDLIEQNVIDKSKEPFSIRAKPFWDITLAKNLYEGKFSKEVSHEVDGLIFQPCKPEYKGGRCDDMLKWKPSNLNSIDFKLDIRKEHKPGMLPELKGYLFVGGLEQPFGEIKISKDLKQFNNKIIECKLDNGQWKMIRQRTDKSFPNSFTTASAVLDSILKPVTKELLYQVINEERWIPSSNYISQHSSSINHNAPTNSQMKPSNKRSRPKDNCNSGEMPPPKSIPKH